MVFDKQEKGYNSRRCIAQHWENGMKISGRIGIDTMVYLDRMDVENPPSSQQSGAGNFPF